MDDFGIEVAERGARTTVLRVRGPLDARTAPMLIGRCAAPRADRRHLLLNLSGVSLIASSGVGALLALVEECRQQGIHIRIANASTAVDSVVRLLNIGPFLGMAETEDAALAALEP